MDEVTLTWPEVLLGATLGIMRRIAVMKERVSGERKEMIDTGDGGWSSDVEGACGEMAFAKWLGIYFEPTINTFRTKPDVAGYNVRTRSKHEYELNIRKHELTDKICVLLTGLAPTYRIRGWLKAKDAAREEWLQDYGGYGRAAYFVPHDSLHPMDKLRNPNRV